LKFLVEIPDEVLAGAQAHVNSDVDQDVFVQDVLETMSSEPPIYMRYESKP